MKAIALVVVTGGTAFAYAPDHVDLRIVDLDNVKAGDPPDELPPNTGFDVLCKQAGLKEGEDFTYEDHNFNG